MQISVWNEYDPLETVLVGHGRECGPLSISNEQNYHTFHTHTNPNQQMLADQTDSFASLLKARGIDVLRPASVEGLTQIFTRDIGFVIGDVLFRAPMAYKNRLSEWAAVPEAIQSQAKEFEDKEARAEGGDIVLADDTVFVGVGNRTTHAAAQEIARHFPTLQVVEVALRRWDKINRDPDGVLHLDCAFVPIDADIALVYPPALQDISSIQAKYEGGLISINQKEKFLLGTNVLAIGNRTVVSAAALNRVNTEMRQRDINVIEIEYGAVCALGGALRCSTLPLLRRS